MELQPRYRLTSDSRLLMGTLVSIQVVGNEESNVIENAIDKAFSVMRFVETMCSRFDDHSALRELCRHPREWMKVPDVLFETLRLALTMSELTDGAFDPTIGNLLDQHGFNTHYLTNEAINIHPVTEEKVSFRDISLEEDTRNVYLNKPMLLDLGAVAKGFAVDLAAKELSKFNGFVINAGGDLYLHGIDPTGESWTVGIQHPEEKDAMIAWLKITDAAVCTSGTYERRSPINQEIHHLFNPVTGKSTKGLLSCTVIAPFAMLADAVSTAAFVLGKDRALDFVNEVELDALCINDMLEITMTDAMERYLR